MWTSQFQFAVHQFHKKWNSTNPFDIYSFQYCTKTRYLKFKLKNLFVFYNYIIMTWHDMTYVIMNLVPPTCDMQCDKNHSVQTFWESRLQKRFSFWKGQSLSTSCLFYDGSSYTVKFNASQPQKRLIQGWIDLYEIYERGLLQTFCLSKDSEDDYTVWNDWHAFCSVFFFFFFFLASGRAKGIRNQGR